MAHAATVQLSVGAAYATPNLASGDESRQRLPAIISVSLMSKGNLVAEENSRSLACRTSAAGNWENQRRTMLTGFQTRKEKYSVHSRFLGQGSENIASVTAFQESKGALPVLMRSMPCTKEFSAPEASTGTMMPDHWLEESVFEIVRNISEAPFIHYVFDMSDCTVRTERQRVLSNRFDSLDCWRVVRDSLAQMAPDGIIFVQRLESAATGGSCLTKGGAAAEENAKCAGEERRRTDGDCERRRRRRREEEEDVWGIVVVGKSITRCACYLLKTTKVASAFGICTSYCVTRANCCGPSCQDQLQNMWLLLNE